VIVRPIHHGLVDSTSERAFAALAAGEARHGDLHVATGQTAGRGRRGRRWESAEGEGLYASLVLCPPQPLPAPGLTMAAGLAVLDALDALAPEKGLRLDWPNDVVADGAKLSGILVESRGLDREHPRYVVGMGVNVGQRSFPATLTAERRVTSLRLLGSGATLEDVLGRLGEALPRRFGLLEADPNALARAYLEATGLLGREVLVRAADTGVRGRVLGLDLGRGLSVAGDSGERTFPLETISAVEDARPGPV